jgi:tetratricopeptide (TPR) repeat protein
VIESRADHDFAQAMAAVDAENASPIEKVEMLVEMAHGLVLKPKNASQIHNAISLYDRALACCPDTDPLLTARVRARKASALQAIPGSGTDSLLQAREELEAALPGLHAHGASPEEIAETELALGVVLQSLAGLHAAKIGDAIAAYQRAARVFNRQRYPRDFAILQNNLATAYLSVPVRDERAKLREALAVQAFTEALEVVSLIDDPSEYAMLQNNLGNALQYASSGHPVENCVRALAAYDEALKVRNPRDTPTQYANTISNKANCLRNLPDESIPTDSDVSADSSLACAANPRRLRQAIALYTEAAAIFRRYEEAEKAAVVEQARAEIELELAGTGPAGTGAARPPEHEFGESRVI